MRYVAADVSTFAGADGAVRACRFTPDVVFCCAGGAKPGFFLEQEEADFELALRTDYWTALSTAHAAAGAMVRGGVRGRVVFVSSVLGFMGFVGYAQYSPMKYAIRGLAECLRSELLPHGIHVHAFFPATILSPGYEQENTTKPEVTKAVEGADEGLTPEQCATQLLRGVERDEFFIADGFVGRTLRMCSSGTAPGNGPFLLELFAGMLARVRGARRSGADGRWLWRGGAGSRRTGPWCSTAPRQHARRERALGLLM